MRGLAVSDRGFRVALAVCGAGVAAYAVAALILPPGADLARHVRWFLVSFAFYLLATALVLVAGRHARGEAARPADLALILGVALLLRAALLATQPSLSDDVFRYVWDGKVLNAGIDPYRYPPSAPELAPFRGPLWEGINAKSMSTPYPPLAEGLFAAAYRVAPDSLLAMQVMAVAFDLGVVALLVLMLARAGLDPRRVLIYAWNPLVLVQFAHSGHYDAAMILPLLGAIYLMAPREEVEDIKEVWGHPKPRQALRPGPALHLPCPPCGAWTCPLAGPRGRGMGGVPAWRLWASGALLGVSALVKLVPAIAAPLFLPWWGLAGATAMATVTAVGLVPWLGSGTLLAGVASEAADARFNDSLGYLLVRMLGLAVPNPEGMARAVAWAVLAAGSLLLAGLLWRRGAGRKGILTATYHLLGLFLLLNAVVEPWYLTWMVPFLCFVLRSTAAGPPRADPALGWLLLSGLVVLTDLTYLPGAPPSTWIWVRAVEYLPLYCLLAIWIWRRGMLIARSGRTV